jgi:hypothetical protein
VNQPLVESRGIAPATRFSAMADRIKHMEASPTAGGFGGAVVIVPPSGGEPIEILMLDPHADLAMFWSTIMTKIQMQLGMAEAEKRRQGGFGQGR